MTSNFRVFSREHRTWQIEDGDNVPRDLPGWLVHYCWLNYSLLISWVALCVSLGGIGFNLLSRNPFAEWIVPLGLIIPGVSLAFAYVGVTEARRRLHGLRSGVLGKATITHCSPTKAAGSSWHIGSGDADASWQVRFYQGPSPTQPNVPVREYVQRIRDQHLAKFDTNGAYIGTKVERILTLVQAVIFGGVLGMAAGIMSGLRFDYAGLLALVAAIISAIVEDRKKFLLRLTSSKKPDSKPLGSNAVNCRLEVVDAAQMSTQFFAVLDLEGNEQDYLPKCVLLDNFSEPLVPSTIPIPSTLCDSPPRLSFSETGLRGRLIVALVAAIAIPIASLCGAL